MDVKTSVALAQASNTQFGNQTVQGGSTTAVVVVVIAAGLAVVAWLLFGGKRKATK